MKKKAKKKYIILSVELECWGGKGFKHPNNTGGFMLKWACQGIGFGEIAFVQDKKKGLICDTECMSKDFVDAVLKYFLNKSVKFVDGIDS